MLLVPLGAENNILGSSLDVGFENTELGQRFSDKLFLEICFRTSTDILKLGHFKKLKNKSENMDVGTSDVT